MLEAARRRQVERAPRKAMFPYVSICFLSCSLYCEVLFTLLQSILGISGEADLGHGRNSRCGARTRFQTRTPFKHTQTTTTSTAMRLATKWLVQSKNSDIV